MTAISILLPTRGRPALLRRLFESLSQTTSDTNALEIILYIDEDDLTNRSLSFPSLNLVKLIRPPGNSMGRMIRECYQASHGRYLMLMNDDAVFRTQGWDRSVLEAFNTFPEAIALVYGNDLDQGERVPTFPILSRQACELMEGISPDGYLNLHIESHLFDIFNQLKRLGHLRIIYLKDVIFEHRHCSIGKAKSDDTYIKKSPLADDRLFIALAEERRNMAQKLASYIEMRTEGHPDRWGREEERAHDQLRPIVSIVIPCDAHRASVDGFLACLDSIAHGTDDPTPHEWIIGGSGNSVGHLPLFLSNLKDRVKTVQTGEESGFAKIGNQAAQTAQGEFLIFLSPSAIPTPGWIDALVKAAATRDGIAVVGSKHLNPRNGRIHHAGIAFYSDGGIPGMSYLYRGVSSECPQVNRLREFQAVSAGCMLVNKSAFFEMGGFDETLKGMADTDLCLRFRGRGMKVLYTPEAMIYDDWDLAYSEGGLYTENLSALFSKWMGKITYDLYPLLQEDGFFPIIKDSPLRSAGPMIRTTENGKPQPERN